MLASDLNNPEFVNPMDPDALMHVEFYWHEPVDGWASRVQGKTVKLPKQVFVRIMKPGDQTSILEVPIREDHKKRWPQKWLYFQMQEGLADKGVQIQGWKITEWDELNGQDELIRNLQFLRFHTVEQIAGASDAQIQGMGIGGPGLRDRAVAALRNHVSAGVKAQIEARDAKIAAQDAMLQATQQALLELQEQFKALASRPAPEATEPRQRIRRGWPKGKSRKQAPEEV